MEPTVVIFSLIVVVWFIGLLYGQWRVLVGLASRPGPVGDVNRWVAFRRIFTVHLGFYLLLAGLGGYVTYLDGEPWVEPILGLAAIFTLFALLPAAGITMYGWRFRSLLRWVRCRIGLPPGR